MYQRNERHILTCAMTGETFPTATASDAELRAAADKAGWKLAEKDGQVVDGVSPAGLDRLKVLADAGMIAFPEPPNGVKKEKHK